MCLAGHTGLLLLQMVVRPDKSPSSSVSGGISLVSLSLSPRQSERILQYVSSACCKRLSNSLTDGAKINKLSSMTTYSVPKISFCPNSVEMNTEETLDFLLPPSVNERCLAIKLFKLFV